MGLHLQEGGDDLQENHEINVTPFIDVMLVLLIIFMVAAPLATVDVPVNLPSASARAVTVAPQDPLTITLRADLTLALGNDPVTEETLPAALRAASAGQTEPPRIHLRADRTVPYGALMAVMELLRQAGFAQVALVAAEAAP